MSGIKTTRLIAMFDKGALGVDLFLLLSAFGLQASLERNTIGRFYLNLCKIGDVFSFEKIFGLPDVFPSGKHPEIFAQRKLRKAPQNVPTSLICHRFATFGVILTGMRIIIQYRH